MVTIFLEYREEYISGELHNVRLSCHVGED